jgi:hypothetical protein
MEEDHIEEEYAFPKVKERFSFGGQEERNKIIMIPETTVELNNPMDKTPHAQKKSLIHGEVPFPLVSELNNPMDKTPHVRKKSSIIIERKKTFEEATFDAISVPSVRKATNDEINEDASANS